MIAGGVRSGIAGALDEQLRLTGHRRPVVVERGQRLVTVGAFPGAFGAFLVFAMREDRRHVTVDRQWVSFSDLVQWGAIASRDPGGGPCFFTAWLNAVTVPAGAVSVRFWTYLASIGAEATGPKIGGAPVLVRSRLMFARRSSPRAIIVLKSVRSFAP